MHLGFLIEELKDLVETDLEVEKKKGAWKERLDELVFFADTIRQDKGPKQNWENITYLLSDEAYKFIEDYANKIAKENGFKAEIRRAEHARLGTTWIQVRFLDLKRKR